jgi:hypothetical protein
VVASVSDPSAPSQTLSLNGIAVDSSRIYVMSPEYVIAFPLDVSGKANATVLLDCGSEQPCEVLSGLAVDAQNVYAASWGAGGIVIIPKAGGNPVTIHENSTRGDAVFSCPSCGMATNGSLVCWISGCSTVACLPTTIGSSTPYEAFTSWDTPCLYGLGLDGSNAYTMVQGVVTSASLTTIATEELAAAQQNPSSITVDDKNVYWLITPMDDATGCTIQSVPKLGGTPTTLLDCSSFSDQPVAIAVDSTYVWFATSQGAIKRMPKGA